MTVFGDPVLQLRRETAPEVLLDRSRGLLGVLRAGGEGVMTGTDPGQIVANFGQRAADTRFQLVQFNLVDLARFARSDHRTSNFAIIDHLPGVSRALANLGAKEIVGPAGRTFTMNPGYRDVITGND